MATLHHPVTIPAVLALLPVLHAGQRPAGAVEPVERCGPGSLPAGLSASDWSSIRASYEAGRRALVAVEGGYQASNPGQQWRACFDGRGFLVRPDAGDWSWGLELASYGDAGHERCVDTPSSVFAT